MSVHEIDISCFGVIRGVSGPMEAFLSYTRIDDEFFGGAITSLRRAIELGVQVNTGDRNFKVFQDIDGIELGEKWQERLDEALSSARFLIPIITPLFFSSDACRNELQKFIRHEKDLGRNDLIIPIYFVITPSLENPDQVNADALGQEIRTLALEIKSRQYRDWRSNAHLPINNPDVKKEVFSLSAEIARAINRAKSIDLSAQLNRSREIQFRQGAENIMTAEKPNIPNATAPKLVLWVDDRPENNIGERAAFEKYNVEFVLATSTEDALVRMIQTRAPFEAIISDMGRPPDPQAGYTLLKAVRDSGSMVPYFIYAGSRAPEHQREALARGAQGTTNIGSELIDMVLRSLEPRAVELKVEEPKDAAAAAQKAVAALMLRSLSPAALDHLRLLRDHTKARTDHMYIPENNAIGLCGELNHLKILGYIQFKGHGNIYGVENLPRNNQTAGVLYDTIEVTDTGRAFLELYDKSAKTS